MRPFITAALLVAAASSPVLAQGVAFSIPSDTPGTGTCNAIPFGSTNGSASWTNQRYQTLVTAADLANTPTVITGLRFAPCSTGVHNSRSMRVTLALVPPGFSFASGNTNFDQNLNVLGSNAVVVLDRTDHYWEMTGDQWSSIGIDDSYFYDGQSDLLIDIVVEGQTTTNNAGQMHRDTRPRLYAVRWTGQPPATGTASNAAAKIRIESGCTDITMFGAACAGLDHTVGGSAAFGSTLDLDLSGGDANTPAALNLGNTNGTPFPIDMTPHGFTGCAVLCDSAIASLPTITDGTGAASVSIPVPNMSSLLGFRMFTQYMHLMPSAPGGFAASDGGRIVLGSGC